MAAQDGSRAEPAPFIGDDLFASFDEGRTANGVAALAAIGDRVHACRLKWSCAEVGKVTLGDSEIIEDHDRLSAVVDTSTVTVPDNCILDTVMFDGGQLMNAKLSRIPPTYKVPSKAGLLAFRDAMDKT